MRDRLQRIDPAEADELDEQTHLLLRRWAARQLDVPDEQVERVLVEVTGGCGEGTCEFTTARAEVNLGDGRVFLGPDQGFGLFIRDIVEMDVNPDGTEVRGRGSDLWELFTEDGVKVAPKPVPPRQPEPPKAVPPRGPTIGASIRQTQEMRDLPGGQRMVVSQRTEVYTAHGWIDLREVIAAFDAEV